MRELIILLKYGLKGSSSKSSTKTRRSISGLLLPLIAVIGYGVPIGVLFADLFRVYKDVNINGVNFATIFVADWSVMMVGVFILSFVPSLVNSFVRNEEIQLLLTMPVRRSTIVFYQAVLTLIFQSFAVVMYLFIMPAYAIGVGKNLFISVISALLMCFALIFLSILIAAVVGIWMNRSTARRMNFFSILIAVVLFLVATQLLPQKIGATTFSFLTRTGQKVLSEYNPLVWPVLSLDNPVYIILLFVITFALWSLSLKVSEKISFEDKAVIKKHEKGLSHTGVYSKDLRLLFRYEQGVFMIIYPIAIGLIFSFTTKSFMSPLFILIFISTMYVSMSSAMLMKQEFLAWPLAKIMPLTISQILVPKMIIPAGLYSLVTMILSIFLQIYFKLSWTFYFIIPVVFVMFAFAAVLGIHFFIKEREKNIINNPSRILNTLHVFAVEGIVFALTIGSVLPLVMYMYSKHLLLSFFKKELLVDLIGLGLPIVLTATLIFLIRRYFKQLLSMIDKVE